MESKDIVGTVLFSMILLSTPMIVFAEIDQNRPPMTLDWNLKDGPSGTYKSLQKGDKILVSGTINAGYESTFEIGDIQTDVGLTLSDPAGDIISVEQVEPICGYDQCYFEWTVVVGSLWKHTGQYEIQACYLGYNNPIAHCASTQIPYVEGTDEEFMITITDSVVMDRTQIDLEFNKLHVNYEITVMQNGKMILQETAHSMEMIASHMIDAVGSNDSPIAIKIVSFGVGLLGDNQNWSGPVGIVAIKQIVSEFGTIAVWADKDTYYSGDTVILSGYVQPVTDDTLTIQIRKVDYNEFPTVLSFIKKPDMNGEYKVTFSVTDLGNSGNYNVKVVYGTNKLDTQTAFEFKTQAIVYDNVPPLILTPSDISVETTNQHGTVVTYSVKAIDDVNGVVNVSCGPFSGTTFPLGETLVICSAKDDAGNSATKSFVVTVKSSVSSIPDWIKNVAEFWCNDEIDDASFVEAIQYLIENNVITVPLSYDSNMNIDQTIPNWIKNNACWWSQGLISDDEFASGLEYLIEQGIVTV